MKSTYLTAFILFTVLFQVWSQRSRKEIDIDSYYNTYNYAKAITKYEKLTDLSDEGLRKLADCYRKTYNYAKAISIFEKWINTSKATKDDIYNYASVLRMNNNYVESNKWMAKFSVLFPNDLRSASFTKGIKTFSKILYDENQFRISNLKINNEQTDFGTSYYKDSIVFASSRAKKSNINQVYNWNQKPFLNLYIAKVVDGEFVNPVQFTKNLNKKWHEGTASFSNNGTFMAFTRDNYSGKGKNGEVNLQLFFSIFRGNKWSNPVPFRLNDPEFSIGHPSLTEDGKTLYFASNMPGGYGGVDIYCVKRLPSGEWGKPQNLGPNINTEDDDMFPFFEETNQMLFFASKGHFGLGGLDIFRSKLMDNVFCSPTNLGSPINSKDDDYALIIDKYLRKGYFSSNRIGGKGDDDIYSFEVTKPLIQTIFTHELYVVGKDNGKLIANAVVEYSDSVKVETNNEGKITRKLAQKSIYHLRVNALGYQNEQGYIKIGVPEEGAILRDTVRMKIVINKKIILKNIYYNFDKWDILPASALELDKVVTFLQQNQNLKIELSSHTDRRGSDKYNMRLSQLRAESAVNYIISKGISSERIEAVGYGKRQLVNPCVDCTDEEHRQNRRTEMNIPGFIKSQQDTSQFRKDSVTLEMKAVSYKDKKALKREKDSIFWGAKKSKQIKEEVVSNNMVQKDKSEIKNMYILFVAFYQEKESAQKLTNKLIAKGYNATMLDFVTIFRVGINCNSMGQAKKIYRELKSEFPSAWVDYVK